MKINDIFFNLVFVTGTVIETNEKLNIDDGLISGGLLHFVSP